MTPRFLRMALICRGGGGGSVEAAGGTVPEPHSPHSAAPFPPTPSHALTSSPHPSHFFWRIFISVRLRRLRSSSRGVVAGGGRGTEASRDRLPRALPGTALILMRPHARATRHSGAVLARKHAGSCPEYVASPPAWGPDHAAPPPAEPYRPIRALISPAHGRRNQSPTRPLLPSSLVSPARQRNRCPSNKPCTSAPTPAPFSAHLSPSQ